LSCEDTITPATEKELSGFSGKGACGGEISAHGCIVITGVDTYSQTCPRFGAHLEAAEKSFIGPAFHNRSGKPAGLRLRKNRAGKRRQTGLRLKHDPGFAAERRLRQNDNGQKNENDRQNAHTAIYEKHSASDLRRSHLFLSRPARPAETLNSHMEAKDSNGNILKEGDSVTVIKDLKVRGSSSVIKRGTMVRSIRLTDDAREIEGKVDKTVMVLKTEFLKKA
jgi:protein PhnA